jgi:isoleucyl-tRNA synthetase
VVESYQAQSATPCGSAFEHRRLRCREERAASRKWVEIDRYALAMTRRMAEACMADYARFEFHLVAQRLQNFCSEDLGAFWLDILKDRLYTTGRDSHARRSRRRRSILSRKCCCA